jgi:glutathione S-transferase
MKLYEFGPTRAIRARWTLQELGVGFEAVTVNLVKGEHTRPEFRSLNPAGKLPVLVDDDFVLTESVAIVVYLAEKYPRPRLLPDGARERADLNRWMLFTVTELEQPLWRITRQSAIYPEAERLPGDIPIASREFREMASIMESRMRDRQFLMGDDVTVGDFVLAYTLDWGNEFKLLDQCPKLVSYMERMYARPHAPKRIAQLRA